MSESGFAPTCSVKVIENCCQLDGLGGEIGAQPIKAQFNTLYIYSSMMKAIGFNHRNCIPTANQ